MQHKRLYGIIQLTRAGWGTALGNITVSLPSDGTTADVSDYNTPITTIVNTINGGLDNSNLASGAAISTSKLATDAGITSGMLANEAVTYQKLDADSGYVFLKETTLGTAGDTISVTSIPARKFLKIVIHTLPTGGTTSNTIRFNNDATNNYSQRHSEDGAADSTATSQSSITMTGGTTTEASFIEIEVVNIATQEKLAIGHGARTNTSGAGSAPIRRRDFIGKWSNTANSITQVDVVNGGTGDFAVGSRVVVFGYGE